MKTTHHLLIISIIFSFSHCKALAQPWFQGIPVDSIKKLNLNTQVKLFENYWNGKTPEKGKGYKPFRRWQWFMENRIDANGEWDAMSHWNGWIEKIRLFPINQTDEADWQPMGPNVIPLNGGGCGRINSITFHPTNPEIIWIGSASGGAWVTNNNGQSWRCTTDSLPLLGVADIVIDHTSPNNIYLATGDCDGGATFSIGVLKSTNSGLTWNTTGLSFAVTQYRQFGKLAMDRANSSILIAATHGGIYRSTNGANDWSLIPNTNHVIQEIKQSYFADNVWFATANGNGILKSTNNGLTWSFSNNGLPTSNYGRIAIALTPSQPQWIYALYSASNSGFLGVYRSTNLGESWQMQSNSPNLLGWSVIGDDIGGQGWYDLTIAVSPSNPELVYVGGVNVWKSTNAGVNWQISAHWYGANGTAYTHADQHCFAFKGDTLFVGNDGGIFKTPSNEDAYLDLSRGLGITQVYRIGISNFNPTHTLSGTQDNGTNLSQNATWRRVIGGDGMECLIDYSNPLYMYGEYQNGVLHRSVNGGLHWVSANNGVGSENRAWVAPVIINPVNPRTLYRATTLAYKSTDRAQNWVPMSPPIGSNPFTSLVVAPSDTNRFYMSNNEYLYRTTNGGTDWSRLRNHPTPITYIAVHPENPEILWITCSGYNPASKVWKSMDGGNSWINQSFGLPNLPVNCIVIRNDYPDQLYIGTDVGCFLSQTGGGNWINFSQGMPNVIVNELEINLFSEVIVAGTYGRGLWLSPLENVLSVSDENSSIISEYQLTVSPNPFNTSTKISLSIPKSERASILVFDSNGREVVSLKEGLLKQGIHTFNWNAAYNATGIYFIRYKSKTKQITHKLVLLK